VAASARGKQRTDSTHVLAKIRALNRVLCVGETLRHALNCLAIVAPESKSCGRSGCRTTCGARARSTGALLRIFLRRPALSVRPTISRRITAKSAVRPGWVIAVHLTETCEKDSPHLITHVETTSAPVSDDARTALIHEDLKRKDLLPEQHSVDTG
jgi:hypothetical protein